MLLFHSCICADESRKKITQECGLISLDVLSVLWGSDAMHHRLSIPHFHLLLLTPYISSLWSLSMTDLTEKSKHLGENFQTLSIFYRCFQHLFVGAWSLILSITVKEHSAGMTNPSIHGSIDPFFLHLSKNLSLRFIFFPLYTTNVFFLSDHSHYHINKLLFPNLKTYLLLTQLVGATIPFITKNIPKVTWNYKSHLEALFQIPLSNSFLNTFWSSFHPCLPQNLLLSISPPGW